MNYAIVKSDSLSEVQATFPENFKADKLKEYVIELELFSHEAFQNPDSPAWHDLQSKLFEMNQRLIRNGHGLGTPRSLKEWVIRDVIERVEKQYLPQEKVPIEINDGEIFLDWLKNRIQQHCVNYHPLFDLFDNNEVSDEDLRYFLSNHWVYTQNFHLHIAAYSLLTPFEMREELFKNIHDELGQGNFSEAHPNLFKPLLEHFGGFRDEDVNFTTRHFFNTEVSLCWFADGLHYGIGGMGALELSVPLQHHRILEYLRRRGLSTELVKFFELHCLIDQDHADGWFAAGMPYMKTHEDFQKVFEGAMRILQARVKLYDGILKAIQNPSKAM